MKIVLFRKYFDKYTLGYATIHNEDESLGYAFKTLELPNLDNKQRISCIPEGIYKCQKNSNEKFGNHFDILSVPKRAGVKIHAGNYTRQILGCILVGEKHLDIDKDGIIDVTNSKSTLEKIYKLMPDTFDLEIKAFL